MSNTSTEPSGVLLVGHGTRDSAGLAEIGHLAAKVARRLSPVPVETGFIELAEPMIGAAVNRLLELGVRCIRVVPLLLFEAGHAKFDIPAAIREAQALARDVRFDISPPLSLDEPILSLSKRRYDEALAGLQTIGSDQTYWLLVGRGSSDQRATEDLASFAKMRAEQSSLMRFGWCFVAAAKPTLDEGLDAAAASRAKRIVVQPHLLFRGSVLEEVRSTVARWQAKRPHMECVITAHLGPEEELVQAIVAQTSD